MWTAAAWSFEGRRGTREAFSVSHHAAWVNPIAILSDPFPDRASHGDGISRAPAPAGARGGYDNRSKPELSTATPAGLQAPSAAMIRPPRLSTLGSYLRRNTSWAHGGRWFIERMIGIVEGARDIAHPVQHHGSAVQSVSSRSGRVALRAARRRTFLCVLTGAIRFDWYTSPYGAPRPSIFGALSHVPARLFNPLPA